MVSGFRFGFGRVGLFGSGLVFKFGVGGFCRFGTGTRNLSIRVWFSCSGFGFNLLFSLLFLLFSRFLKKFNLLLILFDCVFLSCLLGWEI